MRISHQLLIAAALTLMLCAGSARATFVAEYFNNYGTVAIDRLNGLNGGVGWGGAWVDSTGGNVGVSGNPGYEPNLQTSFTNANYSTDGNESDTNDGRALIASTDSSASIIRRSFLTPLTGTIWMSALVRHASNVGGDVILWFETQGSGSQANTFVALRTGDVPTMRYMGTNTTSADLNSSGTNLLFLAKIELDYSGSFDRISFWVKNEAANLSSEAALGSPLLTNSGIDVLGNTLTYIGLSGGGAIGNVDSLRYADGPDALALVLRGANAVPAPLALPAGAMLLGTLVLRRRTRSRS
ncbi:MAG: hypothetical protein GC162_02690 [Planctomycetes bacterium]|nr:hypothetical protein [Planctomycetota bacterium]